ncbi:MAG TPA: hypothetical protein VGR29_06855, partial [Thermomicrobiales bacterium]|nr:hypothetical protein [Thermomicrobiales bacterium]
HNRHPIVYSGRSTPFGELERAALPHRSRHVGTSMTPDLSGSSPPMSSPRCIGPGLVGKGGGAMMLQLVNTDTHAGVMALA